MSKGKEDSGNEPSDKPTGTPTPQPTPQPTIVLTFYSVNTDPNVVGPLYNLAVQDRFVDFNDDDQYCNNEDNPTCATLDHSTCDVRGPTASPITNVPIAMSFYGYVGGSTSSCCAAKSCAAVYLDTEAATLSTGDTFSYTVSF
jgi:hypothetical protein